MLTRTKRVTLTFRHPFSLKGVDRRLAAGEYEVATDEELIEGLSSQHSSFCPLMRASRRRWKWSLSIPTISRRLISWIRLRQRR